MYEQNQLKHNELRGDFDNSGAGDGGERATTKVMICRKFGQNFITFVERNHGHFLTI